MLFDVPSPQDEEVQGLLALIRYRSPSFRLESDNNILTNILDMSRCGPARHAVEACLQGIERVTALDANPRMLEYAGKLAAAAGAKVHFIEGRLEEVFSSEANLPVSSCAILCEALLSVNSSGWWKIRNHTTWTLFRDFDKSGPQEKTRLLD